MLKAIETSYKGYRFRSRLEARWAVFFDHIWSVKWEYEKEGYDLGNGIMYLPDFWIPLYGTDKCGNFIEIKHSAPNEKECEKMSLLADKVGTTHRVYCFWGDPNNWHARVYVSERHIKGVKNLYVSDGVYDHEEQSFMQEHLPNHFYYAPAPFGVRWLELPHTTKQNIIKEATSAFFSARFEFGEEG
jgi:hypothetical protein